ncbi:MAG: hypothetical protein CL840_17650 [Crocinitomicaceae bacterium]|nr:hypothetical protein [Crocinitomicaceae bacterium]|tara:strand:+ start:5940 stop:7808 length:1869 start_codon:yes stop_codon:yes gene_type:complete
MMCKLKLAFLFTLLFIGVSEFSKAQNRIDANGSIEGFDGDPNDCQSFQPETHCPSSFSDYPCYSSKWISLIDSWEMVDRVFTLNPTGVFPTPDRFCGNERPDISAFDGEGYIQLKNGVDGSKYRVELVCMKLGAPMTQGNRYLIQYRIASSVSLGANDKVGVFGSEDKVKQTKKGKIKTDFSKGTKWTTGVPGGFNWSLVQVTYHHTNSDNYNWLTFGALHNDGVDQYQLFIDDVKVYDLGPPEEECPAIKYVQNSTHTVEVLDASQTLKAGYNVGAAFPAVPGNVFIGHWGNVVFKAGEEVNLEPGFSTGVGTSFLAYIDPCESDPCPGVASLPDQEYLHCNTNAQVLTTGFTPQFQHGIKWTPSTHLSASNVKQPIFDPPPNSSGTIYYNVEFKDPCGNVANQMIKVSWSDLVGTAPVISMSNLVNTEYELSFDLAMQSESKWLEIDVKRKSDGAIVLSTGQLYHNSDYWSTFHFEVPCPTAGLTVCEDYEVIIRTKNKCVEEIATQTIDWDRSTFCSPKPEFIGSIANVFTPNGDGINDDFCVNVCGAEEFEIVVVNIWGDVIFESSGSICSSFVCMWDGSINQGGSGMAVNGEYFLNFTIKGCGGEKSRNAHAVTILG